MLQTFKGSAVYICYFGDFLYVEFLYVPTAQCSCAYQLTGVTYYQQSSISGVHYFIYVPCE